MKKKIKVYGVPTCPFCKRARKFFKDKGFDFEDLDVSVNHDLAKYFNIRHTTLQIECESCPTGFICDIG